MKTHIALPGFVYKTMGQNTRFQNMRLNHALVLILVLKWRVQLITTFGIDLTITKTVEGCCYIQFQAACQ